MALTVSSGGIATVPVRGVERAAALRRAMIQDVETTTFDLVEIERNEGLIFDEMLASRIGALVLRASREFPPAGTDVAPGEVGCRVAVRADGPREVLASEIKMCPGLTLVHDGPLTILPAGGRLELTAFPRRGTGRTHIKWSPVSAVYFEGAGDDFKFVFETTGALTPQEILDAAEEIL